MMFFATVRADDGQQHELIFHARGTARGEMDDDELRALKRQLRLGDTLHVTAHAIERSVDGDVAVLHVRHAELLMLSLRMRAPMLRLSVNHKLLI